MVANKTRRTPNRRAFRTFFVVKQQDPGAYVGATGKYGPGTDSQTTLKGSIQPADSDAVEQLPENERGKDSIVIWTDGINSAGELIKIRSARFGLSEQTQGDEIDFDGVIWNVWKVDDYRQHGHQEIICAKKDGQNG